MPSVLRSVALAAAMLASSAQGQEPTNVEGARKRMMPEQRIQELRTRMQTLLQVPENPDSPDAPLFLIHRDYHKRQAAQKEVREAIEEMSSYVSPPHDLRLDLLRTQKNGTSYYPLEMRARVKQLLRPLQAPSYERAECILPKQYSAEKALQAVTEQTGLSFSSGDPQLLRLLQRSIFDIHDGSHDWSQVLGLIVRRFNLELSSDAEHPSEIQLTKNTSGKEQPLYHTKHAVGFVMKETIGKKQYSKFVIRCTGAAQPVHIAGAKEDKNFATDLVEIGQPVKQLQHKKDYLNQGVVSERVQNVGDALPVVSTTCGINPETHFVDEWDKRIYTPQLDFDVQKEKEADGSWKLTISSRPIETQNFSQHYEKRDYLGLAIAAWSTFQFLDDRGERIPVKLLSLHADASVAIHNSEITWLFVSPTEPKSAAITAFAAVEHLDFLFTPVHESAGKQYPTPPPASVSQTISNVVRGAFGRFRLKGEPQHTAPARAPDMQPAALKPKGR